MRAPGSCPRAATGEAKRLREVEPHDPHARGTRRAGGDYACTIRRVPRGPPHKTQVCAATGGALHRPRLPHTLEVSQIARSIAAALGLNADLVEAVALAHDLGHPPFGHAGEQERHALM